MRRGGWWFGNVFGKGFGGVEVYERIGRLRRKLLSLGFGITHYVKHFISVVY